MVFVLALTLVIFVMAFGLTPHGPYELLQDWIKGFWQLLTFAMQMSILMITGFVLADSKIARRGITRFVTMFKSTRKLLFWYGLILAVVWWLHWGIGLMLGIIMGRELAARNRGSGLHYPMIAAMAYAGIVCAGGPSQAPPLLVATPGHFIEKLTGVIPITETVFMPQMILLNVILVLSLPVLFMLMAPAGDKAEEISEELAEEFLAEAPEAQPTNRTPAEFLNTSFALPLIIGILGLIWAADFLIRQGIGKLDLNSLNFIMLMLGLLMHRSLRSFTASVGRGVITVGGVIIQFPFYAGIFGIISNSGLSGVIAGWFVSISSKESFPLINFIYSGIMNIFVPSGGSKFVIEAPYTVPAAQQLGVGIPYVVNSYVLGDLWTNLIQPFWALPILGAFKVRFQQILPYGLTLCIIYGVVLGLGIYFLPFVM